MDPEKQQQIQKEQEDYLKLWEEPPENEEDIPEEKPSEETIQLKLEMPLKEGLLKVNMGIPFIFVINKSDFATSSSEKKRFEEDSEFIFKHIRKFAVTCKIFYYFKMVLVLYTHQQNKALIYKFSMSILFIVSTILSFPLNPTSLIESLTSFLLDMTIHLY